LKSSCLTICSLQPDALIVEVVLFNILQARI
jgi:hypothetical protein